MNQPVDVTLLVSDQLPVSPKVLPLVRVKHHHDAGDPAVPVGPLLLVLHGHQTDVILHSLAEAPQGTPPNVRAPVRGVHFIFDSDGWESR